MGASIISKSIKALLIFFIILDTSAGIKWLTLGRDRVTWRKRTQCHASRKMYGLERGQSKMCRTGFEIMPYVNKAASSALGSCKSLFKDRRWNCTTPLWAPNFAPDLTTGTREQAFVYALSSASLVYTLSKACASHDIFNCSCAAHPKESTSAHFHWGGCGDNVPWAVAFAKRFTDSAEKRRLKGKASMKAKRGSNPKPDLGAVFLQAGGFAKTLNEAQLAVVNLHNTRAGRKAVQNSLKTFCTCHGLSGSCSMKICWKGVPDFHQVGEILQKKYDTSIEASVHTLIRKGAIEPVRRNVKTVNANDLVYVTKSPDYCLRDDKTGSLGTRGRICNETAQSYDSCDIMCCGRGHHALRIERLERCRCKFKWCCEVICQTCVNTVDTRVCN